MRNLFLFFLLSILFIPNLFSQTMNFKEDTIRFCAGTHEWPPYYYFKRANGEKTKEIVGLDIDIFNEVFTKNGISYSVELLPWKRCLLSGKIGKRHDVVFGGGLNDYRRANYVTTKGYYNVTPSYFYAKKEFPNGIKAKQAFDLTKYGKLCGVHGFNYVNFGQKNENIDMGSTNYTNLVTKTLGQRCKISFVRHEILFGWGKVLNKNFTKNENLVFAPIPNNPLESFHLMISKNYKYSQELKDFFEKEINKLKDSGKLNAILNKKDK